MSSDNSANSIFKITLNLTLACLFSGVIIGLTQYLTADDAKKKLAEIENKKMKKLVESADSFKPIDGSEKWFGAYNGAELVAYIVPTETKGYGGIMKVMTAVTPDGKVMNYIIKEAHETPGLGDKAEKSPFKDQFKGKEEAHLKVTKNPSDKDDILAITGATITSRALTHCVKEAVEKVNALPREVKK